MFIKKAIIEAYKKQFAGKTVCREIFIQLHTDGFKAIQAAFGTYAHFLLAVEESKAVAAKPVAKTKTK